MIGIDRYGLLIMANDYEARIFVPPSLRLTLIMRKHNCARSETRQYVRERTEKLINLSKSNIYRISDYIYYSLISNQWLYILFANNTGEYISAATILRIINIARTCKAHSMRIQCISKTCHAFLRWSKITFASADLRLPFGAHNNSLPRHRGILSIRLSLPRANATTRFSNKYPDARCKSDHDLSRVAIVTAQWRIPRKILRRLFKRYLSEKKIWENMHRDRIKKLLNGMVLRVRNIVLQTKRRELL